jgi:hypothetical protein
MNHETAHARRGCAAGRRGCAAVRRYGIGLPAFMFEQTKAVLVVYLLGAPRGAQ